MDYDLTEDQSQTLTALDRLAKPHEEIGTDHAYWHAGAKIEDELARNGFYEVYDRDAHNLMDAVLVIERMARLHQSLELGASMLVAPVVASDLPRPVALASGTGNRPVRFLDSAKTLILDDNGSVKCLLTENVDIAPIDSDWGYPYGKVTSYRANTATTLDVSVERFHALWRLALSAEISGASAAALDLTVQYVKDRHQFGRPIGTFQAVQHRLAECSVLVRSVHLLTLRAADSGSETDMNLAAAFAQRSAARICFETHQFHGAMGQTLEYPLHYWTQRLKALQGELGGTAGAAADVDPQHDLAGSC